MLTFGRTPPIAVALSQTVSDIVLPRPLLAASLCCTTRLVSIGAATIQQAAQKKGFCGVV